MTSTAGDTAAAAPRGEGGAATGIAVFVRKPRPPDPEPPPPPPSNPIAAAGLRLRPGERLLWSAFAPRAAAIDLFASYSIFGWVLLAGFASLPVACAAVVLGWPAWIFWSGLAPWFALAFCVLYAVERWFDWHRSELEAKALLDPSRVGPIEQLAQLCTGRRLVYAITDTRIVTWVPRRPAVLVDLARQRLRRVAVAGNTLRIHASGQRLRLRGLTDPAGVAALLEGRA